MGSRKILSAFAAIISELLRDNIRKTEQIKRRFRHNATKGFPVLRNYEELNARQRVNAQDPVEHIDWNFPVIKETYLEMVESLMDVGGGDYASKVAIWHTTSSVP